MCPAAADPGNNTMVLEQATEKIRVDRFKHYELLSTQNEDEMMDLFASVLQGDEEEVVLSVVQGGIVNENSDVQRCAKAVAARSLEQPAGDPTSEPMVDASGGYFVMSYFFQQLVSAESPAADDVLEGEILKLAREIGQARFEQWMKVQQQREQQKETAAISEVGLYLSFPIACAMAQAAQGRANVAQVLLQDSAEFWAALATTPISNHKDNDACELLRHGLGAVGFYLFNLAYMVNKLADDPIFEEGAAPLHVRRARAAAGVVGLRLMAMAHGPEAASIGTIQQCYGKFISQQLRAVAPPATSQHEALVGSDSSQTCQCER